MSTEEAIHLERRSGQRFQLHLPVTLHVDGKTFPGYTQDISARGVFIYVEVQVDEGKTVELTFTMPSEITLAENMPVRAHGRVLRKIDSTSGPMSGMAVQLDSYQYLPSENMDSSQEMARLAGRNPVGERAGAISR